ncbi:hypothetical protein CDL15_Pgr004446 [Punica granatum]|uniref:Uncharacterized protein n=1 Tax=Punica granatum TaxID=22663 RepID=A0A218XFL5_PUNGR|nr:hypothetical protein CDL15_Pgr004446 [Punica granatum]PKH70613.1 hypothetical protein CRG98_050065 [Punica granatum]
MCLLPFQELPHRRLESGDFGLCNHRSRRSKENRKDSGLDSAARRRRGILRCLSSKQKSEAEERRAKSEERR